MSNETVLPPKNGHEKNRQPNGTVQPMTGQLKIDHSLEGIVDASITMAEQMHNGETDVSSSKVAMGHMGNAIAGVKTKMSGLRMYEKVKSPAIQQALARLIGGNIGQQLALEAPKQEEPAEDASKPKKPAL
jgi:hypothetical protein